ncbi:MAG: hypothetical protein QOF37_1878, partial [Thermoleophilaceae bacterium]|nr:hypothetical protein [Thermoleophilaceae bacterium]
MAPRSRTWAALAAVGLALVAPSAAAADTTIDFEQFQPGTALTNQYADAGGPGQGVTFGQVPGGGDGGLLPVVRNAPVGQPQSGTQVADISTCFGCEFYVPRAAGTFGGTLRTHVSMRVGYLGPLAPDCSDQSRCSDVTLTALDTSGQPIAASAPVTVRQGAGVHTLLSVSTPTATIAAFRVSGANSDLDETIAMDDLSFDGPGGGTPDFAITPATTFLTTRQAASPSIPIGISRFGGSSGNIQFSLGGTLPPGVHAQFAPNPAGGSSTALNVTVAPDAPPTGPNPVTLTVTATPVDAGAGPAPRSFTLSLVVKSAFDIAVQGPANVDLSSCVVNVPVQVTRDFSFGGPVTMSVTGLPAGVQGSFAPAQATFPHGEAAETVTLVLTGPASGFPVLRRTATIHAANSSLPERTATVSVGGTCPAVFDARITSLQITQGVQSDFLPTRDPAHPTAPTRYSEIPGSATLRAGGPTVVRAYANEAFGPLEGIPDVTAVLNGYTYDRFNQLKLLPGSPLLPTSGPRTLHPGPAAATTAEEGSARDAYTFTLPPAWSAGRLAVSAVIAPYQGPAPLTVRAVPRVVAAQVGARALRQCDTTECRQDDAMMISRIPFEAARQQTVQPIAMTVDGTPPLPDPAKVFKWARVVTPLDVVVQPYAATIDITDLATKTGDDANNAVSDRLNDYTCDNGGRPIGVNTGVARGLTYTGGWCWSRLSHYDDAVVEAARPLTSVSHEFFHLLGRPHASPACGGGSKGQSAEAWPPDNVGFIQGVGLDTVLGSGVGGPYAVISGAPLVGGHCGDCGTAPPAMWFDFMSYCADSGSIPRTNVASPLQSNAWISVHNWNAVLDANGYGLPPESRILARAGDLPSLHVTAYARPDGSAAITTVESVSAPPQPAFASSYHLVTRDAAGNQIGDTPMTESSVHVDGVLPPLGLQAVVPAANVASVAVVKDGVVLATRRRSAHPPAVKLGPIRAANGRSATIRWTASDADRDALSATVLYSADNG